MLPMFYFRIAVSVACFAIYTSPWQIDAADKPLPFAKPETLGVSAERLAEIDRVVNEAIKRGELPGAVVVIVHRGKVIFRRAYGQRSLEPGQQPMLPELVFDLASLT